MLNKQQKQSILNNANPNRRRKERREEERCGMPKVKEESCKRGGNTHRGQLDRKIK